MGVASPEDDRSSCSWPVILFVEDETEALGKPSPSIFEQSGARPPTARALVREAAPSHRRAVPRPDVAVLDAAAAVALSGGRS